MFKATAVPNTGRTPILLNRLFSKNKKARISRNRVRSPKMVADAGQYGGSQPDVA